MTDEQPSDAEWRALFAAARRVKSLAPWEWMDESETFGVENPETGELGFVSIMGNLGEHLAVALYLGPRGLYDFYALESEEFNLPAEAVFEIPQLQLSFEDRDSLTTRDRDVIKSLGLKFRGRQAWPLFRSFAPGLFPWHLTGSEARFLTVVLDQVMNVAPRAKENADLLAPSEDDLEVVLVRVPEKRGDNLEWEDRLQKIPPPEPPLIQYWIDTNLLKSVKRMKTRRVTLEIDFSLLPTPTNEDSPRPYFPYILATLETSSRLVLGLDLVRPVPSFESMLGEIPGLVLTHISRLEARPAKIHIMSPRLYVVLQDVAQAANLHLELVDELPGIEEVQAMMASFMGRLREEDE